MATGPPSADRTESLWLAEELREKADPSFRLDLMQYFRFDGGGCVASGEQALRRHPAMVVHLVATVLRGRGSNPRLPPWWNAPGAARWVPKPPRIQAFGGRTRALQEGGPRAKEAGSVPLRAIRASRFGARRPKNGVPVTMEDDPQGQALCNPPGLVLQG